MKCNPGSASDVQSAFDWISSDNGNGLHTDDEIQELCGYFLEHLASISRNNWYSKKKSNNVKDLRSKIKRYMSALPGAPSRKSVGALMKFLFCGNKNRWPIFH